MVNYKDWDYKELGFNSEKEMRESITRVTKRLNNPKTEIELEVENRNELVSHLKANNNQLDTARLREEARLQELDAIVQNRILYERAEAKRKAEQEEMQKMFAGMAKTIQAEKEKEAQKELDAEIKKAEVELQSKVFSKYSGVKTDHQKQLDDAYNKLLSNI